MLAADGLTQATSLLYTCYNLYGKKASILKIGCSLPFKLFTRPAENEACLTLLAGAGRSVARLLEGIRCAGAQSAELRSVGADADPDDVLNAYEQCRAAGLSVTVHGHMPRGVQSSGAFFLPYHKLFEVFQNPLNITLHALAEQAQTAEMLDQLATLLKENDYPVLLALENSRNKSPGDAANSCENVCNILSLTADKAIGICWDFGHYYYNLTHFTPNAGVVPPDEFLSKVRHTHIHAVYDEKTHYPLDIGELPLQRYCGALTARGYKGLFNLELEPARYYKELDPYRHLISSLEILKEAAAHG